MRHRCQYQDESNSENMNLEHLVEDEIMTHAVENEPVTPPEKYKSKILPENFVLVRFFTKRKTIHYVGQVKSILAEDELNITFLRRNHENGKFSFPKEDNADVLLQDISLKLPSPTFCGTERMNGYYEFPIDFDSYEVH